MFQEKKFKMEIGNVTAKASTFLWDINVDNLNGCVKGEKLLSPIFSFNSSDKWQLTLYPENANFSFLSLFLTHLTENEVTVRYYLALLNQSNQKVKKYSPGKSKFDQDAPSKGFLKFVQHSFIVDPKNDILSNKNLTILCKVILEENAEIKNESEKQIGKYLDRLKEFDSFEKLLNSKEFSDVTVTSRGKIFYLHKNILVARSDVFEAMFRNDCREKNKNIVEIDDIRYEVLQELFQFIYTGKVGNIKGIVCELLVAAEKYCIPGLKLLCEETMCDDLYEENALQLLNFAIINNANTLKAEAIKCISFDLESFIKTSEFQNLGKLYPEILIEVMNVNL